MTEKSQETRISLAFFWMAGLVQIHSGAPALTKSSGCHSAGTHYVSIMLRSHTAEQVKKTCYYCHIKQRAVGIMSMPK